MWLSTDIVIFMSHQVTVYFTIGTRENGCGFLFEVALYRVLLFGRKMNMKSNQLFSKMTVKERVALQSCGLSKQIIK